MIKKWKVAAAACVVTLPMLLQSGAVKASDTGFMVGIAYNFGGSVGFTAKVLSQREPNEVAGALGVSWYPWAKGEDKSFGVDLSAAYNFQRDTAIALGWDFANKRIHSAVGYSPLKDDKKYRPVVGLSPQAPQPPLDPCVVNPANCI